METLLISKLSQVDLSSKLTYLIYLYKPINLFFSINPKRFELIASLSFAGTLQTAILAPENHPAA